jgi:hypothetical protein
MSGPTSFQYCNGDNTRLISRADVYQLKGVDWDQARAKIIYSSNSGKTALGPFEDLFVIMCINMPERFLIDRKWRRTHLHYFLARTADHENMQ